MGTHGIARTIAADILKTSIVPSSTSGLASWGAQPAIEDQPLELDDDVEGIDDQAAHVNALRQDPRRLAMTGVITHKKYNQTKHAFAYWIWYFT